VEHLENLTHLLKAIRPAVGLQRVAHTKLASKDDFPISDEGRPFALGLEDNPGDSERKAVPKPSANRHEQFDEIVRPCRA
jgi:hypothetical protein